MFILSLAVIGLGFTMSDPTAIMLYLQLLQTALVWLVGTGLLAVGKRKLSKIE